MLQMMANKAFPGSKPVL